MKIFTLKLKGNFHAGPKAPSDIVDICVNKLGMKSVILPQAEGALNKIKYRFKIYGMFLSSFFKGEILILQFPMYENSKILNGLFLFFLGFVRKNRTIVVIHDIDGLRYNDETILKQDVKRLNKIGYIVVHNEKMKKRLEDAGVTSKLYCLELFDYLCDKSNKNEKKLFNSQEIKIAYAGNLIEKKSPFLYQLDIAKLKYKFNLYGVGIEKNLNDKMVYKGKKEPNKLPNEIEGDLGLVWDGNFDESDEGTGFKNYTKYNNPHKLSCYLASGLPVIVWRKSAISEFVTKNNIGYVISNLYEINNLDFSDYEKKLMNVQRIKLQVRDGEYTQNVIKRIIKENNLKD